MSSLFSEWTMSAMDKVVLQFILGFGLPLLSILCVLLVLIRHFHSIRVLIISKLMVHYEAIFSNLIQQYFEELFSPLHSMRSADWKLRNLGLLRILEINVRTGENFKFYPKNAHLVVVDSNIYIHQYLVSETAMARLDHLHLSDVHVGYAERLDHIPDGSIDAVVASRVLCSSVNVKRALHEIHRILAPGGKYFFLEHVHERHPHSPLGLLQSVLTVSRLWPFIADNCHLNRDIEIMIRQSGFKSVLVDRIKLIDKRLFPLRLMPSHIIGVATKSLVSIKRK